MPEKAEPVTACVLIIGNEILSGRTRDSNFPYLARALNELGIQVQECRVIADVEAAIASAVNACRTRYDYVFTTGGIGPTHDDITVDSIAAAFGVKASHHPEAVKLLQAHYANSNVELNEARLRMARIPAGATLIDNPVSKAPGFRLDNVFVLAGVPAIARAMFDSITHELSGGAPLKSKTIATYLAEGTISKPLRALQAKFPDVQLGSYPFYRTSRFGTSIVARSIDVDRLGQAAAELRVLITALGGEPIEDTNDPG